MSKRCYKIGDKYGLLTIISPISLKLKTNNRKISAIKCKCDCGGKTITTITKLKNGHTKSCGCLWIKSITKHNKCHTKIYNTWSSMKDRCLNKNNERFKDYGGRDIKICKKWLNFKNFYKDMGDRPIGKTIERINNNGNYCKQNCQWATNEEQLNNTRRNILLTFNGKIKTLSQWARYNNIAIGTLASRIRRKWDIGRALTTE